MDEQMVINSQMIRKLREERAWSQEHLAAVSGISLRTIQRIESAGAASYESSSAIAAAFGLPVATIRIEQAKLADQTPESRRWPTWHQLITLLVIGLIAAILTPPDFRKTAPVAIALWLGCELAIGTRRRTRPTNLT